ncbi:HNH endonuclease signature motif containing protein [Cellulomonas sp. ICMP 17802]|uniref:HNH endonuclease signature motif containing protein n=1 Tax=Cellulomonas sp. ICMP 17802 TaxID=3239199 RepID=UPI00351B9761
MLALAAAVEALAVAADPTTVGGRLPGAAAVEVVREALVVAGRLAAIAARVVPVVEADGCWASDGARSITTWLATQGRLPHTQAADLVRLGRAFRDTLPATAVEAVAGRVPVQAAHAIAAVANTPDRRTLLTAPAQECGEGFLLEFAGLPAAQFRVLTRRWAAHADPGADERGYRDATEREFLTLAQSTDGCHLTGFLTTEHGHALSAALAALTGTSADQAGLPAGRRRAGALVTLTRLALDRDLTGATGTHRPQITAIVDYTTLHRALEHAPGNPDPHASGSGSGPTRGPGDGHGSSGDAPSRPDGPGATPAHARPAPGDPDRFAVAELVGTGPIPDTVLARLACDSAITRIVFGPASQILNVGRTERTYTGPKRRAIIARDRHCQYPTCDAPPALAEIHHTQHWHRDHGTTDTHTGVLLCWHHHGTVHDHGIEITHHPDGHWHFTDRHGQPLRT